MRTTMKGKNKSEEVNRNCRRPPEVGCSGMSLEMCNISAWSSRMRRNQPASPWGNFSEQRKCRAWEHVIERENRSWSGCDYDIRWFAELAEARSWGPCRPRRGGQKPLKSFKQETNMILFTFLDNHSDCCKEMEVKVEVDYSGSDNDNPDKWWWQLRLGKWFPKWGPWTSSSSSTWQLVSSANS